MKTVQDKDGNVIEVADNTPCHAGIDGALPIMLDEVADAAIFTAMAEKQAAYDAGAPERAKQAIKDKIIKLEAEASTPRRLREAILGSGKDWLANQESLIAAERAKL